MLHKVGNVSIFVLFKFEICFEIDLPFNCFQFISLKSFTKVSMLKC